MALSLDEDTTDDILYLARTADMPELLSLLEQVANSQSTSPLGVVAAARDTHTGNTALHYAAANGHEDVLLSLLALDKSPDSANGKSHARDPATALVRQANSAGNTCLHYAALNGHLVVCKLLLLAQLPSFDATSFQKSESGLLREEPRDPDEAIKEGIDALGKDEAVRKELLESLAAKNTAGRDAAGEAEAAEKDEVVGWLLAIMDRLEGGDETTKDEAETVAAADGDDASEDVTVVASDTGDEGVAEGVDKLKVAD